MTSSEYNFQYLLDISKSDDLNHELNKIMSRLDKEITGKEQNANSYLFHLVPILYYMTIATGIVVMAYKIIQ